MKNKIIVKSSRKGGKGVFAKNIISKGELIEVAPYIEVPNKDIKGIVSDYCYTLTNESVAIVFGTGSMYNHSDNCNITYSVNKRKKVFEYRALNKILPGRELTINYGQEYFSTRSLKKK